MSEAIGAALGGDENLHHFVIDLISRCDEDMKFNLSHKNALLQLPVPNWDELAYDQGLVLDKFELFDRAATCMKTVADRGFWLAQFNLGQWTIREPSYFHLDIDGFEYLKRSSGPGHREGMFAYHLYSRAPSPFYLKAYHFIAAACYLPFVVKRMGRLGQ